MPRWKPEDVRTAAYDIAKRLDGLGVPYEMLSANLHLSIPFTASVSGGGAVYNAKPPAYARDCREGLTAPLVHVPATFSASINTLFVKSQDKEASTEDRVRGKIVISEGFSFPGKILEFEQKGALGVIAINPGADSHWGICTSIWGTPDLDDLPRKPTIPVAAVNNPDGQKLVEIAKAGGEVTLKTEMEQGWYESLVPVVTIPGNNEPEKFVLLHGHYDSWDVGVGDNATGDATMLEIARVLWTNKSDLKRSVRIAWWPGHSTGRYAGSTWYADAFALDLDENCVAQVNCDSPGCRWATEFRDVSWMKEAEAYCQKTIMDVTGLDSHGERPHRAGDYAFNNIGLSSFFMLSSTMPEELRKEKDFYAVGGCGGNIAWHTEHDLIEIADRDILLRDIKVYLAAVMGVANADVLPFDWRAQVSEFSETIYRYQKAAGDLADLGQAADAASDLMAVLDAFYSAVKNDTLAAKDANEVIQRLARILVPVNHTNQPRFRHDPALPVQPLPAIAVAQELAEHGPETLGFAQTQMVRGTNRVAAALRDAARLVRSVTP
ncbi:M28 family peptidase [Marivita cryptomonadis]|uniref:Carboxypeptidase Q n=2 Tax=Roseobacteraceae TaxID=2854170 RepID=A0A9Q2S467_9RHOB|nr:M28 family peptidase [Marivita cryptomonadis]MBM2333629.1 M28 family peptidase [Marivita cryptomonadis]MBM2343206.1 M28 family peptidase [Marivita cryptomonadis]MBM2347878.1 M28 family peptidase [Marivita cryptomonadis]MBM2352559.1 M28 family peptidase [Marivita cryptomonadis]